METFYIRELTNDDFSMYDNNIGSMSLIIQITFVIRDVDCEEALTDDEYNRLNDVIEELDLMESCELQYEMVYNDKYPDIDSIKKYIESKGYIFDESLAQYFQD